MLLIKTFHNEIKIKILIHLRDFSFDRICQLGFKKTELFTFIFLNISGHFTQVVWQGTQEVGVAFATYQDGEFKKLVVVGNYYPAGNIMKAFEDNVKAPEGEECQKKEDKKIEKKDEKNGEGK